MNQAGGGDQRGGGFLKLSSKDMKNSEINSGFFVFYIQAVIPALTS